MPDVEIFCTIKVDRDGYEAILINDGRRDVWIPRGQIRAYEQEVKKDGIQYWTLTIPEWLAFEKGLI